MSQLLPCCHHRAVALFAPQNTPLRRADAASGCRRPGWASPRVGGLHLIGSRALQRCKLTNLSYPCSAQEARGSLAWLHDYAQIRHVNRKHTKSESNVTNASAPLSLSLNQSLVHTHRNIQKNSLIYSDHSVLLATTYCGQQYNTTVSEFVIVSPIHSLPKKC